MAIIKSNLIFVRAFNREERIKIFKHCEIDPEDQSFRWVYSLQDEGKQKNVPEIDKTQLIAILIAEIVDLSQQTIAEINPTAFSGIKRKSDVFDFSFSDRTKPKETEVK